MWNVIVCGGRNYSNYAKVCEVLSELEISCIISGGASGADSLAELYARDNAIQFIRVPADWETHGRSAGPKRNKQMLDMLINIEGKAMKVIAFPGGRGTAHMVGLAQRAGVLTQKGE